MVWAVTTVVAVVGTVASIGATVYSGIQQSKAADKAQAAQEAAQRQAEANALQQKQDATLQASFLSQQAKAIKPANFEPGGVAIPNNEARGGGTFT